MPPEIADTIASYSNVYAAFAEDAEAQYVTKLQIHHIPTREEAYIKKFSSTLSKPTFKVTKEHIFRTFIYLTHNCFKWRLNRFQRRFVANITQALAPFLLGDDWDIIGPALCKEFGWDGVNMQTIATAPRRVGKTVAVSIAQCAVAMVAEGSKQATFSTGKRASGNLRDAVAKNLMSSGYLRLIASRGFKQERMEIHPIFGDQISQLDFYPSNKQISIYFIILFFVFVYGTEEVVFSLKRYDFKINILLSTKFKILS